MQRILADTEPTGQPFRVSGQKTMIGLVDFQPGASWTLQAEIPSDPPQWLDVPNGAFDASSVKMVDTLPGVVYRLDGGVMGASAWTLGDDGEAFRG